MTIARCDGVETLIEDDRRYTAKCTHCARTIFRAARRIGDLQLRMVEHHILVCRPLVTCDDSSELLSHFKIAATV